MDTQFNGQISEILKWIGIVFMAGFIGYFGRYLSMIIIERLRKKKPEPSHAEPSPIGEIAKETPTGETVATESEKAEQDRLKLEKKRLKAQKKTEK